MLWIIVILALFEPNKGKECSEAIEREFNRTMLTLFHKGDYQHSLDMVMYNGKSINDLGHYRACLRNNYNYFLMVQTLGK